MQEKEAAKARRLHGMEEKQEAKAKEDSRAFATDAEDGAIRRGIAQLWAKEEAVQQLPSLSSRLREMKPVKPMEENA